MASEPSTAPTAITEDEAALYDRQIRLWGLEAQQRMRNATIVVVNLKGLATEVIKNVVLAGIGNLVVVEAADVSEEDLGAGFFFTESDVGSNRALAAKPRIRDLNPLVSVECISSNEVLEGGAFDALLETVDLVCVTDIPKDIIVRLNAACSQRGKKFYCGSTYGMRGYVFCDLGRHEYIAKDRSAPQDQPRDIRHVAEYTPFSTALQSSWKGLTKRQTKELNPAAVFSVMAVLEWQERHDNRLPDEESSAADELELIANGLLKDREVNVQVISQVPREQIEFMAATAAYEFSPICAVVGGMLAQDILKTLAAKDAPMANFFTFDGDTGAGTVCRLGM